MRRLVLLLGAASACSDTPGDEPDVCEVSRSEYAGTVEVGVVRMGNQFTSITEGQDLALELGLQGFWMFVATTRVHDMRIGADGLGAVEVAAYDAMTGEVMSLEVGCREREFVDGPDGAELASPFFVAINPELYNGLGGRLVRLAATVRDRDGHEAIDERTVVARFPM